MWGWTGRGGRGRVWSMGSLGRSEGKGVLMLMCNDSGSS